MWGSKQPNGLNETATSPVNSGWPVGAEAAGPVPLNSMRPSAGGRGPVSGNPAIWGSTRVLPAPLRPAGTWTLRGGFTSEATSNDSAGTPGKWQVNP